jgi:hypothetical protein
MAARRVTSISTEQAYLVQSQPMVRHDRNEAHFPICVLARQGENFAHFVRSSRAVRATAVRCFSPSKLGTFGRSVCGKSCRFAFKLEPPAFPKADVQDEHLMRLLIQLRHRPSHRLATIAGFSLRATYKMFIASKQIR